MQYGFIPKRSCKSQLLSVLNEWTSILESGDSVDVIYLDFSKAFESIPHLRLLNKLYSEGDDSNDWRHFWVIEDNVL